MEGLKKPIAGVVLIMLASCGGGNDDGDQPAGYDSVISSGLLEIELPNQADRDALPEDMQLFLDDFQSTNETADIETSPRGEYAGGFGVEIDTDALPDGDGTLIVGDVNMEVRFAGGNVNYTFSPTNVLNSEDYTNAGGSFGGSADIVGGYYADTFIGTITLDDTETLSVSGDLNGAFAAVPASEGHSATQQTIGELGGSVANPEGAFDGNVLNGLFLAERVEEEPVL